MPMKTFTPAGDGPISGNDAVHAALDRWRSIDGLIAACLVEPDSAQVLDSFVVGDPGVSPDEVKHPSEERLSSDTIAAGASDVVQVVELMTSSLGVAEQLEEVIITLGRHHHLITPIPSAGSDGVLIVVTLDRQRTNLALARQQLRALNPLLDVGTGPGRVS
jgi:hypothetical protein